MDMMTLFPKLIMGFVGFVFLFVPIAAISVIRKAIPSRKASKATVSLELDHPLDAVFAAIADVNGNPLLGSGKIRTEDAGLPPERGRVYVLNELMGGNDAAKGGELPRATFEILRFEPGRLLEALHHSNFGDHLILFELEPRPGKTLLKCTCSNAEGAVAIPEETLQARVDLLKARVGLPAGSPATHELTLRERVDQARREERGEPGASVLQEGFDPARFQSRYKLLVWEPGKRVRLEFEESASGIKDGFAGAVLGGFFGGMLGVLFLFDRFHMYGPALGAAAGAILLGVSAAVWRFRKGAGGSAEFDWQAQRAGFRDGNERREVPFSAIRSIEVAASSYRDTDRRSAEIYHAEVVAVLDDRRFVLAVSPSTYDRNVWKMPYVGFAETLAQALKIPCNFKSDSGGGFSVSASN
jgi:hypothetical protein